jgi:hypothetical protein
MFFQKAFSRERFDVDEVRAAIRSRGGVVEGVAAVVLETGGTFSVLRRSDAAGLSALQGVAGLQEQAGGSL